MLMASTSDSSLQIETLVERKAGGRGGKRGGGGGQGRRRKGREKKERDVLRT